MSRSEDALSREGCRKCPALPQVAWYGRPQRAMSERAGSTVVESHSIYVSQPAAVADLIRSAGGGAHV